MALTAELQEFFSTLRLQTQPKHISIYYSRYVLNCIWFYPSKLETRFALKRIWRLFNLLQVAILIITLIMALPASMQSTMDFGQDLLWIISATYILAKITFFHFRGTELNKLLEELDMLHCELKTAHGHVAAYEQRLWFFNFESALVILWHCGLALFSILFITLPLWTQQSLPFHAVVPFELHDPIKHPWGHVCIFLWQGCSFVYNVTAILEIDTITSHIFPQLAVNLRVLCIELNSFAPELQNNTQRFQAELKRLIQFHQRLISMIYRTNKVLFLPQIMQMTTGVLQICLSAFVSLAIQNNPAVYKFIVFLILSLVYVSYWCTLGDLVTAQSLEVAVAAYNTIELLSGNSAGYCIYDPARSNPAPYASSALSTC